MKLLIVDDEELTREGLIATLDWEALGITEIYQANDGVNGLREALAHNPDIVLCDVRMPRMDGIAMLERIEARLPDTAAIFMSGYSDKEYLKAAIKLKAISYIEKPIDPQEIGAAIRNAIDWCSQLVRQKNAAAAQTDLAASSLAFQLTIPYPSCKETVDALCCEFRQHYGTEKFKYITTIIVKLEHVPDNPADLLYLYQELKEYLLPMHLHVIFSEKRMYHVVYHIYGTLQPATGTLSAIAEHIVSLFLPFGHCYAAIGETAWGILNACHSYESAVILLQSSFFFETDTVLTALTIEQSPSADQSLLSLAAADFENGLAAKDYSAVKASLLLLHQACSHTSGLMQSQIKTLYYDLFSALYKSRRTQKLMSDITIENHGTIMEIVDSCFSFLQLHDTLCEKTEAFFYDISHHVPENATIYLIRTYIASHYKEPGLSVRDISEYAHLSASYACTFFKNETGTTLNQYMTEFRMEKAKQLLSDHRFRITDISASVGYSDGNYFGKSFKKYTGLSPSEFREKVLG